MVPCVDQPSALPLHQLNSSKTISCSCLVTIMSMRISIFTAILNIYTIVLIVFIVKAMIFFHPHFMEQIPPPVICYHTVCFSLPHQHLSHQYHCHHACPIFWHLHHWDMTRCCCHLKGTFLRGSGQLSRFDHTLEMLAGNLKQWYFGIFNLSLYKYRDSRSQWHWGYQRLLWWSSWLALEYQVRVSSRIQKAVEEVKIPPASELQRNAAFEWNYNSNTARGEKTSSVAMFWVLSHLEQAMCKGVSMWMSRRSTGNPA